VFRVGTDVAPELELDLELWDTREPTSQQPHGLEHERLVSHDAAGGLHHIECSSEPAQIRRRF
jgi:hypothetical protein